MKGWSASRKRPEASKAIGALVAIAILACVGGSACDTGPAPRPNVLIVTLDTTRADHLGCYGYERPTSPNLDALARESILYVNAYSTTSWTMPAHASLFTGKYPVSHGVRHDPKGSLLLSSGIARAPEHIRSRALVPGEVTLARLLSDAGYLTGAVVAGPWLLRIFGFAEGFAHYDDDEIRTPAGRVAAQVTDGAIAWLEPQLDSGQAPFFLFLNYFDPHAPYRPPRTHSGTFMPTGVPHDPRSRKHAIDLYDGEILYMDEELGRLFRFLEARGAWENTLVVVTADHGELFGEHGEWGHERFLWEELVRVPMIVKPPGRAAPRRETRRTSLVDVLPMVLRATDIPIPSAVQGSALARPERPLLSEVHPMSESAGTGRWRAQWHADEKFLWNDLGGRYLFRIEEDPAEATNQAESHPAETRQAELRLHRAFDALPRPPDDAGATLEVDEATREALRQMGYLE